jgi:hypothetical protein
MTITALSTATKPARNKARVLWVACGAHALHDGFTDTLYVLLPLWQAQFALSYAAIGILRALYAGVMAGLQVPVASAAQRIGGTTRSRAIMKANTLAGCEPTADHVSLDRSLSPAQHDASQGPDDQPGRNRSAAQQISRDHHSFSDGLAMTAQPSGDVHRVTEIRDLPLRVTALADDDGPGMNAGAEARRDTKFLRVGRCELRHPLLGSEKTAQRAIISSGSSLSGHVTISSSPT